MPADDDKRHGARAKSQADDRGEREKHPRNTPPRGALAIPVPPHVAAQIAGPEVWTEDLTQPGEPAEVTLARRAARQIPGEPIEAANARRLATTSIATTLTLQRMDKQDAELSALKSGHHVLAAGVHRVELAQVQTTSKLEILVEASKADRAREQERAEKAATKAAADMLAITEAKAAADRAVAEAKAAAERAERKEERTEARIDKAQEYRFELSKLSLGRQVALIAAILTGIAGVITAVAVIVQHIVGKGSP